MPRDLSFDIRARDQTRGAFDSAERNARGFMTQLDAMGRHMDLLATGAKAFAAGFFVEGLSDVAGQIREAIGEVAKIQDVADKTGLAVTSVQELTFAFKQSGVEAGAVDSILTAWSRRLGEAASGSGKLAELFRANGIALRDSSGKLRDQVTIRHNGAHVGTIRTATGRWAIKGEAGIVIVRNPHVAAAWHV